MSDDENPDRHDGKPDPTTSFDLFEISLLFTCLLLVVISLCLVSAQ